MRTSIKGFLIAGYVVFCLVYFGTSRDQAIGEDGYSSYNSAYSNSNTTSTNSYSSWNSTTNSSSQTDTGNYNADLVNSNGNANGYTWSGGVTKEQDRSKTPNSKQY